jgi:hypothetical protein
MAAYSLLYAKKENWQTLKEFGMQSTSKTIQDDRFHHENKSINWWRQTKLLYIKNSLNKKIFN